MTKQVIVLVRHSPFNTIRASEALRVAVGYTLAPNRVTVLLVGYGVAAGGSDLRPDRIGRPETVKHIEALKALGHRVVADRSAHEALGELPLSPEVELLDRAGVLKLLEQSDVVVAY